MTTPMYPADLVETAKLRAVVEKADEMRLALTHGPDIETGEFRCRACGKWGDERSAIVHGDFCTAEAYDAARARLG